MLHYHVLARRYRPKSFHDVLGQENVVTALKNSLKNGQIAHAYLFSGSKGTGKTTLARLFAKALNCLNRSEIGEPCNACKSCTEIIQGTSLDLIELDGASHRGIDDVRKIQDCLSYRPLHGRYTVYLIDEVHMLTKEAFNALLKTLEEPPSHVVFLFATTEVHKVLPTILSRCQRFALKRIPETLLVQKMESILSDLERTAEKPALLRIAGLADGAFRDAESLLDQLLSFHDGMLTEMAVEQLLGLPPRRLYFELDQAGVKGELETAFKIVEHLFTESIDFLHFLEGLVLHFRELLKLRLETKQVGAVSDEKKAYLESASSYQEGQLLHLFDYLIESHERLRHSPSPRMTLEAILLYILRSHQTQSLPELLDRLTALESRAGSIESTTPSSLISPLPAKAATTAAAAALSASQTLSPLDHAEFTKRQSRYETLLQFASVELPGRIEKTPNFTQINKS